MDASSIPPPDEPAGTQPAPSIVKRIRLWDAIHWIVLAGLVFGWFALFPAPGNADPGGDGDAFLTLVILTVASVLYGRVYYWRYRTSAIAALTRMMRRFGSWAVRIALKSARWMFTVRGFVLTAAVVAIAWYGFGVYRDGSETRWLLWKLRFGNLKARQEASHKLAGHAFKIIAGDDSGAEQKREDARRERARRANLLANTLIAAIADPDAECRADSLYALAAAVLWCTDEVRLRAMRAMLPAMRDPDDSVRVAACDSIRNAAEGSMDLAIEALRSALSDSAWRVRASAATSLAVLGRRNREKRGEINTILTHLLAAAPDGETRVLAARVIVLFDNDEMRDPTDPSSDGAPALVAALRDPDASVRIQVVRVLGRDTRGYRGHSVPLFGRHRATIVPALIDLLRDPEPGVVGEAALTLFTWGDRSSRVFQAIEGIVQSTYGNRGHEAMKQWEYEFLMFAIPW